MRLLLGFATTIALLWSGYWYVGSSAKENVITNWISDRKSDGWTFQMADLSVRGFPNRFDTTLTDFTIATPDSRFSWAAPFFQVFALSYKPNHIIAAWSNTQSFVLEGRKFALTSDALKASALLVPNTRLTIDKLTAEADFLSASLEDTQLVELGKTLLATRLLDPDGTRHGWSVEANSIEPNPTVLLKIDPKSEFPAVIDRVFWDTTLTFSTPLELLGSAGNAPKLVQIDVGHFEAVWRDLVVEASGNLTIQPSGYLSGTLQLKAAQWQHLVNFAQASGAINKDLSQSILRAMRFVALADGDEKTIEVPVNFTDGLTYVGPIPVGPAPKIY
jgi:hypothetical protein